MPTLPNLIYDPVNQLRIEPGNRWLFRWGFDFFGNKASKVGQWFPASRFEDMASTVNKSGLARAYIEGKHWTSREVKMFVECPGRDFLNFEHLAAFIMQPDGRAITHVYGMRLQARNEVITCLENGGVTHELRQLGTDHIYPEWTRY